MSVATHLRLRYALRETGSNLRRNLLLTSASMLTSQPSKLPLVKRPASSASWTFMPKSAMFEANCAWAWPWFQPPIIPNPIFTSPFSMNAGMIVCSGRLCGCSVLGWSFSSENSPPRFCNMKPVPGGTRPDPNPL